MRSRLGSISRAARITLRYLDVAARPRSVTSILPARGRTGNYFA